MPIRLWTPQNYDYIYLKYLETSSTRHTGEMHDLVGPVSADFTAQNKTNIAEYNMSYSQRHLSTLWVVYTA